MMQLEELARQATTDAKLAVMDLEAPPIGPAKGKQPAQKKSMGWAKPIMAFAALFLIAGTAWTVFGGNADVEDTRIANVDDLEVQPLVHPFANAEQVSRLQAEGEKLLEPSFFTNEAGDKGFLVGSIEDGAATFGQDLTGTEVRGLPTSVDVSEPPNTFVSWNEDDGTFAYAMSLTLTPAELLAELQHPGVVDQETTDGSDFAYEGMVLFAPDAPMDSVGLDGFTTMFELPQPSGVSAPLLVSTFRGSIDFQVRLGSSMRGMEPVVVDLRDGLTGYLFEDDQISEPGEWLVWEEAPGVVAYLSRASSEITTDQSLVEIANELVTGQMPQSDDESFGEASPSRFGPLIPTDGEIVARTSLPTNDPNVVVQSVVTHVYGTSNNEISMTVTTADWVNANEFHQSELSGTAVSISGNPVFIGNFGDKAVASYQDRDYGQAVAIATDMTPDELLEIIVAHPDINRGEVPDGMQSLGESQRFAADDTPTMQLDVEGFNVGVDAGEDGFYNVSTFRGDAALELAAHRYLEESMDRFSEDRLIRGGKDSVSTVDVWNSRRTLMWGESDDVVVVLESGLDVSDDEIYAWAEGLVSETPNEVFPGEAGPFEIPENVTLSERGDAWGDGVPALIPSNGDTADVQELPNLDGSSEIVASWIYYTIGSPEDADPVMVVTVASRTQALLDDENFDDEILGSDGSVTAIGDRARAVWANDYDVVTVVAESTTPDELLAMIGLTPGIGQGEKPAGMEWRSPGGKRDPSKATYSHSLNVTGFDTYVSPTNAEFYGVTTYKTDTADELTIARFLVPDAPERRIIRGNKRSILTVNESLNRVQLTWAETDSVLAILETTPDVPTEQLYEWAEALVWLQSPDNEAPEGDNVDEMFATSPAQDLFREIESEGNRMLLTREYNGGAAADIFYEFEDGSQVCIATVGLGIDPQCFPVDSDETIDAYFFRSVNDDVDNGERSVLVIDRVEGFDAIFESYDEPSFEVLSVGYGIIIGSTDSPKSATVEGFDQSREFRTFPIQD